MKSLTDREVRLRTLEHAAEDVVDAVDSHGLKVILCSNPMDIDAKNIDPKRSHIGWLT